MRLWQEGPLETMRIVPLKDGLANLEMNCLANVEGRTAARGSEGPYRSLDFVN